MAGYETAALELLALLWVLGLRWRYTQDRREWREMLAAAIRDRDKAVADNWAAQRRLKLIETDREGL